MILGGVLAIGAFIVFLIAAAHHSASATSAATASVVTASPAPAATNDSPPSTTATADSAAGLSTHDLASRKLIYTTQASGVYIYLKEITDHYQIMDMRRSELGDEAEQTADKPQIVSDAEWKNRVMQTLAQIDKTANDFANISTVPVECAPLNLKVQAYARSCDLACHDFANGVADMNEQEIEKAKDEMKDSNSQGEALQDDMKNLYYRYTN